MLEAEQRNSQEISKEAKRNDRKVKELTSAVEEERKNQVRLEELVNQLQNKIKSYKRQIEETEEIASMNLAKYRKAQHELDDAAERADQAENLLSKQRALNRSSVSVCRDASPQRAERGASVLATRAGSVRR